MSAAAFRFTADAIVVLHTAFVLFVLVGGLLVLWRRWVIWLHLPALAWGVAVEFSGWICPLTPLENELRSRGGTAAYSGEFIEQYLLPLLYPADLTRRTQIVLGTFALAVNLVLYWRIVRRGSVTRTPS
jgi:uncharacterized protein DUF2784